VRFHLLALSLILPVSNLAQTPSAPSKSEVVQYHATIDTVKYLFGAAPPVARLRPGNILDANSLDCFGNALQKPGDSFALVKGDNPLTVLSISKGRNPAIRWLFIFSICRSMANRAWARFHRASEPSTPRITRRMLEKEALPEKIWFYPIDHAERTATFQALDSTYKVKIPLHPFLGCIGVAPANGEARSSIVPAEFGGNMDAPEVSVGNTLYLPVNVAGALFYFGDGHAAMGDGEIAGSAIEVPMKARLQFDLLKGKHTGWPRLKTKGKSWPRAFIVPWMTPCGLHSLSWLGGFTRTTASRNSMPMSCFPKSAKSISPRWLIRTYVVVASIEKKYLPPKK